MFGPDFYRNPYPTYQKLRAAGAMHFSSAFGGSGTWLVPRYEGAAKVFNDTGLTAVRSHRFFDQYTDEVKTELSQFAQIFKQWVVFLDPPDHGLWRKVMMAGFVTSRLKDMREGIAQAVDRLLDSAENSKGFDFIREFSYLLPILVIASVMGVDTRDNAKFIDWADDIARFFGNPGAPVEAAREAQKAVLSLYAYFQEIVERRLVEPRDDAVSLMIRALELAPIDPEHRIACIRQVLPAQCAGLLFAGHETTSNLLGNGMQALFQHPDQLAAFILQPELAAQVVREITRYDTSAQFSSRIVEAPVVFLSQKLMPGQIVIALTGSANRDETVFSDPDVFKIDRSGERQPLTFGNGRHFCLGSHLATMEMEIAFRKLVERFPRLAPSSTEVEWTSNFNFRGIQSLPVAVG
jgi:cytochrome P450